MECVLLQEAQSNNSGDFQGQLLVIRKNIATDLFDTYKKDIDTFYDKVLEKNG